MSVSGVPSNRYSRRKSRAIPEHVVSARVPLWQTVANCLLMAILALGSLYGVILHAQNVQLQDEVHTLKNKNQKLVAAQDLKNKAGNAELKQP